MPNARKPLAALAAIFCWAAPASAQPMPPEIAATGETPIVTLHAEGAQVYECKADAAGKLAWAFREPVATLFEAGKTVGRHYAGPYWELADGSLIQGKVTGRAASASSADIPWLKLEVTTRKGTSAFAQTTTIQRINTRGGQLEGACETAGAFRAIAYSADYVYLKK